MALVLQDGRRVQFTFTLGNTGQQPGTFRVMARIIRPDRTWDTYSGRFFKESDVTEANAAQRTDYVEATVNPGAQATLTMYSSLLGPLYLVGPANQLLDVLVKVIRTADNATFDFKFASVLQLPAFTPAQPQVLNPSFILI